MLLNGKKIVKTFLTFLVLIIIIVGDVHGEENISQSKVNLVKRIFDLLEQIDNCKELTASTKLSAVLSGFLIKQKVRFLEPTRYERQVFYHLLHKLNAITRDSERSSNISALHKEILENVFQKNVLLLRPHLKFGHIDANLEYESLENEYENSVSKGSPNETISDLCLANVCRLSLKDCSLNKNCLNILISDEASFGYQRTHQIFLLYVLMHHKCAGTILHPEFYDLLAHEFCTMAHREQNVIRSWGLPIKYRDLYMEQIVICGLFGFNEFLNWRNIVEISSWPQINNCFCMQNVVDKERKQQRDCNCNNHLTSLALVYYINAFLMLN